MKTDKRAKLFKKFNRYRFFNIEKAIQALAYIQRKAEEYNKFNLLTYLFFADRLHLRRYFSFISKDSYYVLKFGPAASRSLDILNKNTDYLNYPDKKLRSQLKKISRNRSEIVIHETDTDYLNTNERLTMDSTVNFFKGKPVIELSHEYPEWKRYEALFADENTTGIPVKLEDFFSNPDINNSPLLKNYFRKDPLYEDEKYLAEAKQYYLEEMGSAHV
jgi:hypothetical protein